MSALSILPAASGGGNHLRMFDLSSCVFASLSEPPRALGNQMGRTVVVATTSRAQLPFFRHDVGQLHRRKSCTGQHTSVRLPEARQHGLSILTSQWVTNVRRFEHEDVGRM